MAQRLIHYLFGEIVSEHIEIKDKTRFLLGNVLPDAIVAGERDKSHYKVRNDSHVYVDYDCFRETYLEQILQDDLYLGYYMHLIVDSYYRRCFFTGQFRMPTVIEEIEVMHEDYNILNSHIVGTYNLRNVLNQEFDLKKEAIDKIAIFRLRDFLKEMSRDFTEQTEGTTVFLTEQMVDDFVEKYAPMAVEEIKNVKQGVVTSKASDFAWPRRSYS